MITLNAICLNWAIQQERMKELAVTTASDRKQILSLLLGNMQMHYTYSECQLPDIILIDKLKNEITLSSIIADKRKLVLKFSPQNCYPCIEFSMSCLEKFALSIPNIKERLLIIISDANYREYQAISNSLQSDIPIYLSKGEFYQFNLSSCIRQQNSLTAQFVSFSLSNLANIFYPPNFYNN